MPQPRTARFLGVSVQPMTIAELTDTVVESVSTNQKRVIANHNMHSLYLFHKEAAERPDGPFQRYFSRAHRTHIDGMSIVLLARLYGQPARAVHRVGYTDWLPFLMASAVEKDWRVFYLGSAPGVVDSGVTTLRERHPGLQIEYRHGYFDVDPEGSENKNVLQQIADFQPHLLMVGMGMPRQERWIEANLDAIQAKVILATGAVLDYVAGVIPTPPRWSGPLGLEWAFRLVAEPRRLASRYLIEPWKLIPIVLRNLTFPSPTLAQNPDSELEIAAPNS
jgi:N-acetylglucosaminyldiphosphoundecaprenol N-acetyl-beta-D-mannosaminyltransferase